MNRCSIVMVLLLASVVVAAPDGEPRQADTQRDEYKKRRDELNRQLADEHCALGKWCLQQELSNEAKEHFRRALALHSAHSGARTALEQLDRPAFRRRRVQCEVWLKSGTHVQAELAPGAFRVETDFGAIALPFDEVDMLQVDKGCFPDVIISDGFCGRARLLDECLVAETKAGVLTVKHQQLDCIRILRPCPSCDGETTVTCSTCKGKGRLYEEVTCEQCGGTGKVQCPRCGGVGRISCPKCDGQGWVWRDFGGMSGRFKCGRCEGRGVIDCPSCIRGLARCPLCKGRPVIKDKGLCPDCNGKKVVPCKACGGTGIRPFSAEARKELERWLAPVTQTPKTE